MRNEESLLPLAFFVLYKRVTEKEKMKIENMSKEKSIMPKIEQKKKIASASILISFMITLVFIVGGIGMLMAVKPASASSDPIQHARVLIHFNLASGQQPENMLLEPDGSADVTFATVREVAQVTRDGKIHVLATLPAPAMSASAPVLGGTFMGGIVRTSDGTLYFNYSTGTSDLTGIWRLPPGAHALPERLVALPANGLANGLALDEHTGMLYVADSVLGVIWRVSVHGGIPTVWANGPKLASAGFLGANGIKIHNGAVWITNTDAATVLRIPINHDGSAGVTAIKATGLNWIDDFAFIGNGDTLLAALNKSNQLALVTPDGKYTIVLTATDGLSNPTSVVVRGKTIDVANSAYFTAADPNLLLAQF